MIVTGAVVLNPGDDPDAPLIGWQNLLTSVTVAATEAAANYPVSNLANPATHLEWRGVDTSNQYLYALLDGVTAVDYVAIAGHNFGSGQIPVSLEVDAGGVFTEAVASFLPPTDDRPILIRIPPFPWSQMRIRLQTGIAIPRAAVFYCGKLLVCNRKIYVGHTPLPQARKSSVTNGMSESGKFLGRIVTGEWRESSIPFSLVPPGWYRDHMDSFLASAHKTPFFFAWRPYSYPLEVGYAWLTGDDPMPVPDDSDESNLLSFTLTVGGVA